MSAEKHSGRPVGGAVRGVGGAGRRLETVSFTRFGFYSHLDNQKGVVVVLGGESRGRKGNLDVIQAAVPAVTLARRCS